MTDIHCPHAGRLYIVYKPTFYLWGTNSKLAVKLCPHLLNLLVSSDLSLSVTSALADYPNTPVFCRCGIVHLTRSAQLGVLVVMSAEEDKCDLIPVSLLDDGPDTGDGDSFKNVKIEFQQPIFSALNTSGLQQSGTNPGKEGVTAVSGASSPSVVTTSDSESGIFSSESELCVEHDSELDSFCCTEQKVVCSQCPVVGSCQGHTVTRLASRATVVRVSH